MYCTKCGVKLEEADLFAAVAGRPAKPIPTRAQPPGRGWRGTCSRRRSPAFAPAFADYFDLDVTLMRILWLVAALFTGIGFVAYMIAWIAMPKDYAPVLSTSAYSAPPQWRRMSFGQPHHLVNQVAAGKPLPGSVVRPCHEDVRDPLQPCELNQCLGLVLSFQNPGFDVQVPGEVEMLFHGLHSGLAFERRADVDSEARSLEIVGDPPGAPDKVGREKAGR